MNANGLINSGPDDALKKVRKCLVRPMTILSYCNDHRRSEVSYQGKPNKNRIKRILTGYPDVIKVRVASNGLQLHFAPAVLANLVETETFRNSSPSSDEIRSAAIRCPHPHLPTLASKSTDVPLTQLYGIVTLWPVDSNGILSEVSGDEGDGNSGESSPSRSKPATVMFPLEKQCMNELIYQYLWCDSSKDHTFGHNLDTDCSENGTSSASVLIKDKLSLGVLGNIVYLLPDHGRVRDILHNRTAGTANISLVEQLKTQLNNTYALMSDENTLSLLPGKNDVDTIVKDSSKKNYQCYYLVQLQNVSDNIEVASEAPKTKENDSLSMKSWGDSLFGKRELSTVAMDDKAFNRTIQEYLVATCGFKVHSLVKLEPESSGKSSGKVVAIASVQQAEEIEDGDTSGANNNTKRKWDPSILSHLCRWRSCLCDELNARSKVIESGKATKSKKLYLCRYHIELKNYLDGGTTKKGELESAKYLPKKAPIFSSSENMNELKKDLLTIRAASTLLQELWDGKLRATFKSFTKKVVSDMKFRNHLNNSLPSYLSAYSAIVSKYADSFNLLSALPGTEVTPGDMIVPVAPSWSIWKNQDYFDA